MQRADGVNPDRANHYGQHRYCRYRVSPNQSLELLPTAPLAPHVRVFQNRQIMETFGKFRSSKTFVGRDQVREALFIK